jgi:hypothetical protein
VSTSEIGGSASRSDAARRGVSHTSGWVPGLAVFAGVMMILGGIFEMMAGLVALFENKVYVAGARYLFAFDLTTWGWIHLLLGALVAAAGVGVITGQLWSRVVGITLAAVSALANFVFLPYYPIWSLLVIALDVFVISALCVYNRDVASDVAAESR